MVEIIILITAVIIFRRQLAGLGAVTNAQMAPGQTGLVPRRVSPRLASLIDYADRLYAEKKWNAAEKAYLGVLKLDHKNPTAYTHLGIIYSTQKNLADAIECFQIAVRLRPGATTQQNLGLAYFENRNYMKAIAAFDKAIMFEPSASRYLALARAYQKVRDREHAMTALERAADLELSKRTVEALAESYIEAGRVEDAQSLRHRLQLPATPAASLVDLATTPANQTP